MRAWIIYHGSHYEMICADGEAWDDCRTVQITESEYRVYREVLNQYHFWQARLSNLHEQQERSREQLDPGWGDERVD